jgi:hypothetical protein
MYFRLEKAAYGYSFIIHDYLVRGDPCNVLTVYGIRFMDADPLYERVLLREGGERCPDQPFAEREMQFGIFTLCLQVF